MADQVTYAPDVEVPERSRRAVLTKYMGKDFSAEAYEASIEVREVDTPRPAAGQLLVRVERSPINPSDQMTLAGSYNPAALAPVPAATGNEGSGVVVAAGPGGGAYAAALLGKRVAFISGGGAWGEYVAVRLAGVMPLPDDVSFEAGASSFVNPMTSVSFVEIALAGGHKTMVLSAAGSALCKMTIRLAAEDGVAVIGTVRREAQRQELLDLGAKAVVVTSEEGWPKRLAAVAREHGARLAFDAVSGDMTGALSEALLPGGEVHVYGALSGRPAGSVSPLGLIFQQKKVLGFWLVPYLGTKQPAEVAKMGAKVTSKLNTTLATKVRASFPLAKTAAALADYAADMSSGKVLIAPTLQE